jgi:serine protease Do
MKKWRNWSVVAGVAVVTLVMAWLVAPVARGQGVVTDHDVGEEVQARVLGILGGSRTQIGIGIRDVEQADVEKLTLPSLSGVLVQSVREESPAERAGVRTDDVIVSFDGERVRSAAQLTRLVNETPAGRPVPMQVVRGGSRADLEVTPEAARPWTTRRVVPVPPGPRRAPGPVLPADPVPPVLPEIPELDFDMPYMLEFPGRTARLGVRVSELAGDLPEYFGAKSGVLVNAVTPDSPAARTGIRVGDVISTVDGSQVKRPADLRRHLLEKRDQREVKLGIVRDKKASTVTVTLEPPRERGTPRERGVRL